MHTQYIQTILKYSTMNMDAVAAWHFKIIQEIDIYGFSLLLFLFPIIHTKAVFVGVPSKREKNRRGALFFKLNLG